MHFPMIIKHANHGFSILEFVVALSVFSIAVLAAVGLLINVFRAQSKAIATKEVLDNSRFIMELITRELRTGVNMKLTAPPSVPPCPFGLQFTGVNQGVPQERFYYRVGGALWRVAMTGVGSVNCALAQQLSSPGVVIDHWGTQLFGTIAGATDGQPWIRIHLVLHSTEPRGGAETKIDVQTSVVERSRDQ